MPRTYTGRYYIVSMRTTARTSDAISERMRRDNIPTVSAFLQRAVDSYLGGA